MTEAATTDAPIHVLEVKASDFLLIETFDAKVSAEGITQFVGSNANGKSSALTAVESTLRGAGAVPEVPVRAGAERGTTEVVVGPNGKPLYTFRRVYRDSGTTSLECRAADGSEIRSPQKLLDAMFDAGTFDPVDFAWPAGCKTVAARNERRVEMIVAMRPLRIDLRAHDAKTKQLETERGAATKRAKELEAVVKDAVAGGAPDGPEEDETALVQQIALIENAGALRATAKKRVDELGKEIEDAEAQIKKLQERVKLLTTEWLDQGKRSAVGVDDVAPLKAKLSDVRARNALRRGAVADRTRAEERAKSLLEERTRATRLDEEIKARVKEREEAISAASFPVKALTIDSEGRLALRLGDAVVPFEQASTAQRIKVAFAVMASRKPKLRTCLIRSGNDLDDASIGEVAKIAKHFGFQVLLERIVPSAGYPAIEFREGKKVGETPAGGAS